MQNIDAGHLASQDINALQQLSASRGNSDMLEVFACMVAERITRRPTCHVTLGEFFCEYIERHAKVHTKITGDCEKHFRLYLKPWANRSLDDISRKDIVDLQARMIEAGRSEHAANRAVELLAMLYNKAIEWEVFTGKNPAHGVRKFRLQSRERFLQPDELPRFIAAVKGLKHQTSSDYFLMLLWTAQRRANVEQMAWADIDFTRKVWRIPVTKNGTSHNVPLVGQAMEILERRRAGEDKHPVWVFPLRDGSGPIRWLNTAWRSVLERAGIAELRIHDLRRSHASWQACEGIAAPIIGATLNHKDPRSTMIYARLNTEPVRSAMQAASDAMCQAAGISVDSNVRKVGTVKESKQEPRQPTMVPRLVEVAKISAQQQLKIEAKILRLASEPLTKTQLHRALGGYAGKGSALSSFELQRILSEMIQRGVLQHVQASWRLKDWQYVATVDANRTSVRSMRGEKPGGSMVAQDQETSSLAGKHGRG